MDNILGIVSATRELYGKIKLQEMDLKMVQDLEIGDGSNHRCIRGEYRKILVGDFKRFFSSPTRRPERYSAGKYLYELSCAKRSKMQEESKMHRLW